MNQRVKWLTVGSGLIAFGILGSIGGWWDGFWQANKPAPSVAPVNRPGIVITKSKLTGWDRQKKIWEIEAQTIWQSADNNQAYFDNIHNGLIYSVENKRVTFTAGWVRWERFRNELQLGGGLEAHLEPQGIFTTSEAVMQYNQDMIYCPKPIEYHEPNLRISAQSMRVDLKTEELILEGDVQLTQNNDQVRSQRIIYNYKNEKYRLEEPKGVSIGL